MWQVNCQPPKTFTRYYWPFADNYFPRKVRYKTQAQKLANEAQQHNATNITISKVK